MMYPNYQNTEEDQYREKLYWLMRDYNEYESIRIHFDTVDELAALCASLHIQIDLSGLNKERYVKVAYYITGWADSADADRSDAVVVSQPSFNCYGYEGENHPIIDKFPAKVLYNYIQENYTYAGGLLRPNNSGYFKR